MRIIIVGGGTFGFFIAERLIKEQHDIVVIDKNESVLKVFDDNYDVMTIKGNGASSDILLSAGVEDADMILALTNLDEINIVACTMAKYYGVNKKIARITNNVDLYFPNKTEEYFSRLGIDFIADPERACAQEFFNSILSTGITEKMSFAGGQVILGGFRVTKEHSLAGIKLSDMQDLQNYEMRFVAFAQQGGHVCIPSGDDSFEEGDEVFFMCSKQELEELMTFLEITQRLPEKVIVVGGNYVGLHLAQMLERKKIDTYLIEPDPKKAEELSEMLSRAIVFNGVPTDPDLLDQLNLPDVDAFVAVTDDDENNILSCVLTKQMLVKKTYCLIKNSEYVDLLPTMMKIDGVVNVKKVVINTIVKFLRKSSVRDAATLREIDAEVIEVIVSQDSKLLNKKIADLKFPSGAIIGAIIHNDKVIFAKGSQVISLNDRLVVFYLPHVQERVNSIFGKRVL